ncbi:TPA: hypothetical protein QIF36_002412 [Enterobacter kobei]|nr:hypothetical protein [Enterobacter kobei]
MSDHFDERVKKIIPSYPFVQYNDDENVVAFFQAYNEMAQKYLEAFNSLALPCWTSPAITGQLLDWIALGIYGQSRPAVQLVNFSAARGPYDTVEYDEIPYAHIQNYKAGQYAYMNDDIFKRVLTWNFYKGDGFGFSIPWLKRRISRFIHGPDGTDPPVQETYDVGIAVSGGVFTLSIPDYGDGIAPALKSALQQGFTKLPFIYSYDIDLVVMR